jgi:peroxiredoxin
MQSIDWQVAAAIATVISTIAIAASAIAVVLQLRQAARERYFSVTAHLFEIWQSPEFQHDQLFLLHKLSCSTWDDFCALGRGEHPERAIQRVGGYYDRVGNLVRHNLIDKKDILPTIGGNAVAVWYRIEPLVKELRLRENALLFENYETLLPECHECYVPSIGHPPTADTVSTIVVSTVEIPREFRLEQTPTVEPRSANGLQVDQSYSSANEYARRVEMVTESKVATEHTTINGNAPAVPDFSLPDTDGIFHRLSEFTGSGLAVLVYARGAWCPFCLRQLADYAERYSEFKQSGVEVVALSPESQRKSRRMRTGLKLPFMVLSDSNLVAAKILGLIGLEKAGAPTPATVVLDNQRKVRLSTLNQAEKCVFARDTLEFARAVQQTSTTAAIPAPPVERPKPGSLFARALVNMAAGLVSR